jgi:hypothetical protein
MSPLLYHLSYPAFSFVIGFISKTCNFDLSLFLFPENRSVTLS